MSSLIIRAFFKTFPYVVNTTVLIYLAKYFDKN